VRSGNYKKYFKHRLVWVALYALYLTIILISINVFIAEDSIDDITTNMDEKYTYNLIFPQDGKITHYEVTRHNKAEPGKITLTYWTQDNKLDITKVENIQTLKIDVQSMFEDESMKEAGDGVFTIEFNIAESEPLEELTFNQFPEPKSVLVDNQEWWKTNTNFQRVDEEIIISDIPTGKTTVVLYFKEANKLPNANFVTNPPNYAGVNENITFNGSTSADTDGKITSWLWKFGDGNTDSGVAVVHKYSTPDIYTIRLTVRDDSIPFGENWVEKDITVAFGAEDDTDGDGLRDLWEWDNFDSLDEDGNDDPDLDGATNKEEYDADTDPNNPDSKPSQSGPAEKSGDGTDYTLAIIAIIIVVIVILVLMMVLRSKKSKDRVKSDTKDEYEDDDEDESEDDEEIAKMEIQIRRAKKMGLPTGDLEKLLDEARGGSSSKGKRTQQYKRTGTTSTRTRGTTRKQQSKGRSRSGSGRGNRGGTKSSRKR
jgi:PKD repeat protein